jgi:hypothetical protein
MTKKAFGDDPSVAEAGSQGRRTYDAPSLVRYGTLFVETRQETSCNSPIDDPDKSDTCDPDGGVNDGNPP